jgi:hypothetical protein
VMVTDVPPEAPGEAKGQRVPEATTESTSTNGHTPWPAGEARGASGKDLLVWIGYQSYPTIDAFLKEVDKLGLSRRVSRVPSGLRPGETRLWIAHDSGIRGQGVVVGYAVLEWVDLVTRTLPPGSPDWLHQVPRSALWMEPSRGGQVRHEGAIYLRSKSLVRTEPRRLDLKRFRDYKWVARSRMERLPKIVVPGQVSHVPPKRWTKEEQEAFITKAEQLGPYQAAKEHVRDTGRSFEACMYQWKRHLRARQD